MEEPNHNLLKELVSHPGWNEYLLYIDNLRVSALQQLLVGADHDALIALNSRLAVLRQITEYMEIDLFDQGFVEDPEKSEENFQKLDAIKSRYDNRIVGLLHKLIGRP